MGKQLIDREQQGRDIAKMNGSVKRISDVSYLVNSQSGNGSCYNVNATEIGWNCSCPDHLYRGVKCNTIINYYMGLLAWIMITVVVLSIIGQGWNVFVSSIFKGV